MLLKIPAVLSPEQVAGCRRVLDSARWLDGRTSAGFVAARAKHNREADLADPAVRQWSDVIRTALGKNKNFVAAALPAKICPPSFNSYAVGQAYDIHSDSALLDFGNGLAVRTDLAATLFLSEPQEYDGGELVIEDTFGPVRVKLGAGDMVLYPSSSQHCVEAVTRGVRVASYFWIQSYVRDNAQRALLRDLDSAIMEVTQALPDSPAALRLLGTYHNLLRMWSDA